MKRCRLCHVDKPLSDFYANKASSDKKQPYCKVCSKQKTREYRIENPEAIRAIENRRWLNNRENRLKQANEYYQRNKDAILEKRRSRVRPATYREWQRNYYERNKQEIARRNKEWRTQNKEKLRDTTMRRLYGITMEQYNDMMIKQGSGCRICKVEAPKLVIDHCHATGKVRGLLCEKCNFLLGNAKDNEETLASAILYLKEYKRA